LGLPGQVPSRLEGDTAAGSELMHQRIRPANHLFGQAPNLKKTRGPSGLADGLLLEP
jgi:hypothetical protein